MMLVQIQKKIDMVFNLVFNTQKALIYKKIINKVYVKYICALNDGNLVLYSCKAIKFLLIKGEFFFGFRKNDYNSSILYLLK
jgi:hypothetical protein